MFECGQAGRGDPLFPRPRSHGGCPDHTSCCLRRPRLRCSLCGSWGPRAPTPGAGCSRRRGSAGLPLARCWPTPRRQPQAGARGWRVRHLLRALGRPCGRLAAPQGAASCEHKGTRRRKKWESCGLSRARSQRARAPLPLGRWGWLRLWLGCRARSIGRLWGCRLSHFSIKRTISETVLELTARTLACKTLPRSVCPGGRGHKSWNSHRGVRR